MQSLWALLALAAGAAALDLSRLMRNFRVIEGADAIVRHNGLCEPLMDGFQTCLAGNSEPTNRIGERLVGKVTERVELIRTHPNVARITAAGEAVRSRCFAGCLTTPTTTIDCLVSVAVNGKPWEDVTTCMKSNWGTSDVDLSVPEFGNLEKKKEDLRMFMDLALFKFYSRKGADAFWAKFANQLNMLCPGAESRVRSCVDEEMGRLDPALKTDLQTLTSKYDRAPSTFSADELAGQSSDISLLGDEQDRAFIKDKLFMMQLSGCATNFLGDAKGLGGLMGKHECQYAVIPKCFHFLWTIKNEVCQCRHSLTSSGADPFGDIVDFTISAQEDYVNAVRRADFAGSVCRIKEAGKCGECTALGARMEEVFSARPSAKEDFAKDFEQEIGIVVSMLQDFCKLGVEAGAEEPPVYVHTRECVDFAKKNRKGRRPRNGQRKTSRDWKGR